MSATIMWYFQADYAGVSDMSKSTSLPLEVASAGLRGLAISDGHSTDTSSASERLCGVHSEGRFF